jgi:hypothetical protein
MPPKPKLPKHMSGIAGEFLVAAELSRRGYIASLTQRNTHGIDILASSSDGSRQVAIQVKCDQTTGKEWMLGPKSETLASPTLFYVFVRLHDGGQPAFHVVPSFVVADSVARSHREWLAKPGRGGKPHKDNTIRIFRDVEGVFRDAWSTLGLDPLPNEGVKADGT